MDDNGVLVFELKLFVRMAHWWDIFMRTHTHTHTHTHTLHRVNIFLPRLSPSYTFLNCNNILITSDINSISLRINCPFFYHITEEYIFSRYYYYHYYYHFYYYHYY